MTISTNDPWTQVTSAASSNEMYTFLVYSSDDMNVEIDGVTSTNWSLIASAGGANAGVSPDTGGQVQFTPNVMQRVAENLRYLFLKSERLALARPEPSAPSGTRSDDGQMPTLAPE